MSKKAFTLAEVLITLVIIGVIAALTIPNLMTKHEKLETATQVKKIYYELSEAIEKGKLDNDIYDTFAVGMGGSKKFTEKYLIPHLKIAKNCGLYTTGDCIMEYTYLNPSLSKSTASYEAYILFLTNGTQIAVYSVPNNIDIIVDINGKKKPNIMGKDVFVFKYNTTDASTKKLYPFGCLSGGTNFTFLYSNGDYGCSKQAVVQAGKHCACAIMLSGWKISDDYPW